MSTSRIIFGALLGGLLLGCDLAAMWHLEFSFGIVLGASSVTAVVVNFVFEDARRRKAQRLYFEREGPGMR